MPGSKDTLFPLYLDKVTFSYYEPHGQNGPSNEIYHVIVSITFVIIGEVNDG